MILQKSTKVSKQIDLRSTRCNLCEILSLSGDLITESNIEVLVDINLYVKQTPLDENLDTGEKEFSVGNRFAN